MVARSPSRRMTSPIRPSEPTRTTSYICAPTRFWAITTGPATRIILPCIVTPWSDDWPGLGPFAKSSFVLFVLSEGHANSNRAADQFGNLPAALLLGQNIRPHGQ